MERFNSASRLKEIIFRARDNKKGDAAEAFQVWLEVFAIESEDDHEQVDEIRRCLKLVRDQIHQIKSEMKRKNLPEHLYVTQLDGLKWVASPRHMAAQWSNHKTRIREKVTTSMSFWVEMVEDNEKKIEVEDLEKTLRDLKKYKSKVVSSGLPEKAKAFIIEQIRIIERAFREYEIAGISVFKSATYEGQVHYLHNQEIVEMMRGSDEGNESIQWLTKIWGKVATWVSHIDTAWSLGEKIIKMLASGEVV